MKRLDLATVVLGNPGMQFYHGRVAQCFQRLADFRFLRFELHDGLPHRRSVGAFTDRLDKPGEPPIDFGQTALGAATVLVRRRSPFHQFGMILANDVRDDVGGQQVLAQTIEYAIFDDPG